MTLFTWGSFLKHMARTAFLDEDEHGWGFGTTHEDGNLQQEDAFSPLPASLNFVTGSVFGDGKRTLRMTLPFAKRTVSSSRLSTHTSDGLLSPRTPDRLNVSGLSERSQASTVKSPGDMAKLGIHVFDSPEIKVERDDLYGEPEKRAFRAPRSRVYVEGLQDYRGVKVDGVYARGLIACANAFCSLQTPHSEVFSSPRVSSDVAAQNLKSKDEATSSPPSKKGGSLWSDHQDSMAMSDLSKTDAPMKMKDMPDVMVRFLYYIEKAELFTGDHPPYSLKEMEGFAEKFGKFTDGSESLRDLTYQGLLDDLRAFIYSPVQAQESQDSQPARAIWVQLLQVVRVLNRGMFHGKTNFVNELLSSQRKGDNLASSDAVDEMLRVVSKALFGTPDERMVELLRVVACESAFLFSKPLEGTDMGETDDFSPSPAAKKPVSVKAVQLCWGDGTLEHRDWLFHTIHMSLKRHGYDHMDVESVLLDLMELFNTHLKHSPVNYGQYFDGSRTDLQLADAALFHVVLDVPGVASVLAGDCGVQPGVFVSAWDQFFDHVSETFQDDLNGLIKQAWHELSVPKGSSIDSFLASFHDTMLPILLHRGEIKFDSGLINSVSKYLVVLFSDPRTVGLISLARRQAVKAERVMGKDFLTARRLEENVRRFLYKLVKPVDMDTYLQQEKVPDFRIPPGQSGVDWVLESGQDVRGLYDVSREDVDRFGRTDVVGAVVLGGHMPLDVVSQALQIVDLVRDLGHAGDTPLTFEEALEQFEVLRTLFDNQGGTLASSLTPVVKQLVAGITSKGNITVANPIIASIARAFGVDPQEVVLYFDSLDLDNPTSFAEAWRQMQLKSPLNEGGKGVGDGLVLFELFGRSYHSGDSIDLFGAGMASIDEVDLQYRVKTSDLVLCSGSVPGYFVVSSDMFSGLRFTCVDNPQSSDKTTVQYTLDTGLDIISVPDKATELFGERCDFEGHGLLLLTGYEVPDGVGVPINYSLMQDSDLHIEVMPSKLNRPGNCEVRLGYPLLHDMPSCTGTLGYYKGRMVILDGSSLYVLKDDGDKPGFYSVEDGSCKFPLKMDLHSRFAQARDTMRRPTQDVKSAKSLAFDAVLDTIDRYLRAVDRALRGQDLGQALRSLNQLHQYLATQTHVVLPRNMQQAIQATEDKVKRAVLSTISTRYGEFLNDLESRLQKYDVALQATPLSPENAESNGRTLTGIVSHGLTHILFDYNSGYAQGYIGMTMTSLKETLELVNEASSAYELRAISLELPPFAGPLAPLFQRYLDFIRACIERKIAVLEKQPVSTPKRNSLISAGGGTVTSPPLPTDEEQPDDGRNRKIKTTERPIIMTVKGGAESPTPDKVIKFVDLKPQDGHSKRVAGLAYAGEEQHEDGSKHSYLLSKVVTKTGSSPGVTPTGEMPELETKETYYLQTKDGLWEVEIGTEDRSIKKKTLVPGKALHVDADKGTSVLVDLEQELPWPGSAYISGSERLKYSEHRVGYPYKGLTYLRLDNSGHFYLQRSDDYMQTSKDLPFKVPTYENIVTGQCMVTVTSEFSELFVDPSKSSQESPLKPFIGQDIVMEIVEDDRGKRVVYFSNQVAFKRERKSSLKECSGIDVYGSDSPPRVFAFVPGSETEDRSHYYLYSTCTLVTQTDEDSRTAKTYLSFSPMHTTNLYYLGWANYTFNTSQGISINRPIRVVMSDSYESEPMEILGASPGHYQDDSGSILFPFSYDISVRAFGFEEY